MPEFLRWEEIETSSDFRRLPENEQRSVRAQWWYQVAPYVYGEQLQNPEVGPYLYNRVVNGPHLPYIEGEEEVITPETLGGLDGYRELHTNQAFSRMNFQQQQQIKEIWFSRLLATNPEVQSMGGEQLEEFHRRLMARMPSYGSRLEDWISTSNEQSGLLLPHRPNEDYEVEGSWREEQPYRWWLGMRTFNTLHGAIFGAGSLVLGPARAIADTFLGRENEFSLILDDLQKEHQWVNMRHAPETTAARLAVQAIPTFTGYMAGILAGPYVPFENMLAGTSTAVGSRMLTKPGVIQRAVQRTGTDLVSAANATNTLTYQVVGGAIAGGIQGIGDALARGEPWWKNVPMDATLGVAFEVASRAFGTHMAMKAAMRSLDQTRANTLLADVLNTMDETGQLKITPELEGKLNANPQLRSLIEGYIAVNENGILQNFMNSRDGLQFQADHLGYELRYAPDGSSIEVYDPNLQTVAFVADRGNEAARINEINDFFATSPRAFEAWKGSFEDANFLEAVMNSPQDMRVSIGTLVPAQVRSTTLTFLENHGIDIGASTRPYRQFVFDRLRLTRPDVLAFRPDPGSVRASEIIQASPEKFRPYEELQALRGRKATYDYRPRGAEESTRADFTSYTDPDLGINLAYRVENMTPKLNTNTYRLVIGFADNGRLVEIEPFETYAFTFSNMKEAKGQARELIIELMNNIRKQRNTGNGFNTFSLFDSDFSVTKTTDGDTLFYSQRREPIRDADGNPMRDSKDNVAYKITQMVQRVGTDDAPRPIEAETPEMDAIMRGSVLDDLPPFADDVTPQERVRLREQIGLFDETTYRPRGEAEKVELRPKRQAMTGRDIYAAKAFEANPHTPLNELDRIIHTVRADNLQPARKRQRLAEIGVHFSDDAKEANAIIADLRRKIDAMWPGHPVVYTNVKAKRILDSKQVPVAYLSADFISEPQMAAQTVIGRPNQIREILKNIDKADFNAKVQHAKTANGIDALITQHPRDTVVEIEFQIPDGKGGTAAATLYFPSLKSARAALEEGRFYSAKTGKAASGYFQFPWFVDVEPETWAHMLNKGAKKIPDSLRPKNDMMLNAYEAWVKEARKANRRQGTVPEFLPYTYATRMANQSGYRFGIYNGTYILQDVSEGVIKPIRQEFKKLEDVYNFLRSQRRVRNAPDLISSVHPEAMAEVVDGEIPDPIEGPIPYKEARALRDYGFWDHIRTNLAPAQYAIRNLENLRSTQQLYDIGKRMGMRFNLTEMWNTIIDAQRGQRNFIAVREAQLKRIAGKSNRRQLEVISDYIEALLEKNPGNTELDMLDATRADQRTRAEVFEDMVEEFGRETADELVSKAAQFERFYDEMFSMVGLNFNHFIRHYIPHIRADVESGHIGISYTVHRNRFGQMPDLEKETFIQLLREGDPREVALQRDALKLAETYTHLVGRMMFTRPTLQRVGNVFREIDKQIRSGAEYMVNDEWKFTSQYFANIISTLEGVRLGTDEAFAYAATRSLENIADMLNKKMGTNIKFLRKIDPIGRLISLSTGAHIAGRPFPVFRNLTQSIVFSSTYGTEWWYKGLERVLNDPMALRNMDELGVTVGHNIVPTGAGAEPGRFISTGMTPYKGADTINRAITYYAMEARVNDALRRWRTGAITDDKFIAEAGLRLFGRGNYNELARAVNTMNGEQLMRFLPDRMGRLAVDHTQYLYDRFAQPQLFRSGIGRMFGQYTSWPNNFFSFMKNAAVSDSMTVAEKAKVLGGTMLVTGAIAMTLHEAGLDGSKFLPWNMGMVSGGPYYKLINDLVDAANGDLQAWGSAGRAITSLIPYIYEYEGLHRAILAFQEGEMYEGIMHVMSAPLRYDLYPRRQVPTDVFEEWWMKLGSKYVEFKRGGVEQLDKMSEHIQDFRELFG